MTPLYMNRTFYDASTGCLTPEEPQTGQMLVDSPLQTKKRTVLMAETSQDEGRRSRAAKGSDQPLEPDSKSRDAINQSALRFMVVGHPDQLKDKTQMRKNRMHVMHNYLAKEAQKPDSKDSRVHGSSTTGRRRKQSSNEPGTTGTSANLEAPRHIFRPDVSRLTPAASVQSNGSSHEASDQETRRNSTSKAPRMSSGRGSVNRGPEEANKQWRAETEHEKPLVTPIGGNLIHSRYMQAATSDIPFNVGTALTSNNLGGHLEPFGTWPAFSDSSMHVNELKWLCSQRFGSSSLSMHWIPTLLRARHAFLSTLCISSAHDDIMRRALMPQHLQTGDSLITRIQVRQGVISMINESINDPEMRTADETIVAVLHVLNSEIMGCDDRSMRVHQLGLHGMIRERGGLDRLGVSGQLANILTITMYLIGALRETPPHQDFVDFAARQDTKIPNDAQRLPESPIYYRPQGYRTINSAFQCGSETYDLLCTLRALTNRFYLENGQQPDRHTINSFQIARCREFSSETVSSLCSKISGIQPAADKDFNDMNSRYTFESIRLAALVYAHALANRIPFSQAATQIQRSTNLTSTSTFAKPLPILIKEALMRTDTSFCWDHLAGVLFWVALIAGAAANPGPIANEEREGEDEDARKWLTAVAVRCCITLSFEYGFAVLETLKRVVGVEGVLAGTGERERSCQGDSDGPVGEGLDCGVVGEESVGKVSGPPVPPPRQRGFADFAQEFMSI